MPKPLPVYESHDLTTSVPVRPHERETDQEAAAHPNLRAMLVNQEESSENRTLPIDPTALQRFIDLYQKQHGVRLDPGAATVKARRILSLFRLIAAHADKELRASMRGADKQPNFEP